MLKGQSPRRPHRWGSQACVRRGIGSCVSESPGDQPHQTVCTVYLNFQTPCPSLLNQHPKLRPGHQHFNKLTKWVLVWMYGNHPQCQSPAKGSYQQICYHPLGPIPPSYYSGTNPQTPKMKDCCSFQSFDYSSRKNRVNCQIATKNPLPKRIIFSLFNIHVLS